jgi:hypothetical protein
MKGLAALLSLGALVVGAMALPLGVFMSVSW